MQHQHQTMFDVGDLPVLTIGNCVLKATWLSGLWTIVRFYVFWVDAHVFSNTGPDYWKIRTTFWFQFWLGPFGCCRQSAVNSDAIWEVLLTSRRRGPKTVCQTSFHSCFRHRSPSRHVAISRRLAELPDAWPMVNLSLCDLSRYLHHRNLYWSSPTFTSGSIRSGSPDTGSSLTFRFDIPRKSSDLYIRPQQLSHRRLATLMIGSKLKIKVQGGHSGTVNVFSARCTCNISVSYTHLALPTILRV